MIKYVRCSQVGTVLARLHAEESGRSWCVIGTTGFIGDERELERWNDFPRLEFKPDGSMFVYKAGETPAQAEES